MATPQGALSSALNKAGKRRKRKKKKRTTPVKSKGVGRVY